MYRCRKGFTLIELLMVVALIVVIAAALFVIINPGEILKRARDNTRISQISDLNKAIAYSMIDGQITSPLANTGVRDSCTWSSANRVKVDGSGWAGGWVGSVSTYMHALPVDPVNIPSTCFYFYMSSSGTWEIDAVIESKDNIDLAIYDTGNAGTTATCLVDKLPDNACRYEVGTDVHLI